MSLVASEQAGGLTVYTAETQHGISYVHHGADALWSYTVMARPAEAETTTAAGSLGVVTSAVGLTLAKFARTPISRTGVMLDRFDSTASARLKRWSMGRRARESRGAPTIVKRVRERRRRGTLNSGSVESRKALSDAFLPEPECTCMLWGRGALVAQGRFEKHTERKQRNAAGARRVLEEAERRICV